MAGTWVQRPAVRPASGLLPQVACILALACLPGFIGCAAGQAAWFHHQPRSLLTLPEAQLTTGHDLVVIDGRESSPHEWDGAATVTFAVYGQGRFLWDEQGLYGSVSYSGGRGWNPWTPGISDADSTCVSVGGLVPSASDPSATSPPSTMPAATTRMEVRRLDLHIVTTTRRDSLGYFAAIRNVNASRDFRPAFADAGSIRFTSGIDGVAANPAVTPWSCEFFIPWELLGAHGGPPEHLWVMVFRVRQEDPEILLAVPHS